MDRDVLDRDPRVVELLEQMTERRDVSVSGHAEDESLLVGCRAVEQGGSGAQGRRVGELEAHVTSGNAPFELVGGALGDDAAVVEDGDPVGELVGLVEVLGGQEDGDAAGGEVANVVPHLVAAARVEPGRGLVEEDHPGRADQRHRQVEAAAHPAGVRRHRPGGRVHELEPGE